MNYSVRLVDRKGFLYVHYYEGGILCKRSLKLQATKPNIAYARRTLLPELQVSTMKGERLFSSTMISFYFKNVLRNAEKKSQRTYDMYKRAIKAFMDFFGDRDVKSFRVSDIELYIEHMGKTLSASSLSLRLAPVRLGFRYAMRDEVIVINPVSLADKPPLRIKKRHAYTLMQMLRLLESSSGYLQRFLYIAFFTGMRAGEIIALDWSDIDLKRRIISVTKSRDDCFGLGQTKTRESRDIFIINQLFDYLTMLPIESGFIVPCSYCTIRRDFRTLCLELGFFYEGLHNTRHTFASLMLQAHESPLLLQNLLGHKDLNMINRVYSHYIKSDNDFKGFGALLAHKACEAL